MLSVYRLKPGNGSTWRDAVSRLVPAADRTGELLSIEQAEAALADDRCYLVVGKVHEEIVGLLSAFRFPDVECGGCRCRGVAGGQQPRP